MSVFEVISRITRRSLRNKRKSDLAWLIHEIPPYILVKLSKDDLIDIYLKVSKVLP